MTEKKKANRRNGGWGRGGLLRRRELKDLYLVWGLGLIMTMYRAERKMWRRMGDWGFSPTHSYLVIKVGERSASHQTDSKKSLKTKERIVMT